MAFMVSSGSNYHYVRRISAESNTDGVLKLVLHGDEDVSDIQFNYAEVLIFTDDQAMVDRLIAAINGAAQ
jgi:hypothetical protein